MKLSEEDQKALDEYPVWHCIECHNTITKAYCGRCDEFYNVGHDHDCTLGSDPRNQHNH